MTRATTGGATDNSWIELTPEDAKLFLTFREYQQTIEMLSKNGVFDIFTGHSTLHFEGGNLQKIEITKVYRR